MSLFTPASREDAAFLSPVRQYSRGLTRERICAVLLEDGPCGLPASPDLFRGKPLTLALAELLEQYGARGTFCVVGDTSGNYPDRQGKAGTPGWNGVRYQHLPEYGQDARGGAVNCPRLIQRLLAGGHELASHGYAHQIYGSRAVPDLAAVLADLHALHDAVLACSGYPLRLATPPHHRCSIRRGYTCYDAYALMGYQYVEASYDGGGRTSLGSYQSEVAAMWKPMEKQLLENPDCLRGRILSLPDGRNTSGRTPVAEGLSRQLRLLSDLGYRVIPASELMERAPFRDVPADQPGALAARRLMGLGWCPLYRDGSLRPDAPLLRGEAAMMLFGREAVPRHIHMIRELRAPFRDMAPRHPYAGAAQVAVETGAMAAEAGRFRPNEPLSRDALRRLGEIRLGRTLRPSGDGPLTHGEFLLLAAQVL